MDKLTAPGMNLVFPPNVRHQLRTLGNTALKTLGIHGAAHRIVGRNRERPRQRFEERAGLGGSELGETRHEVEPQARREVVPTEGDAEERRDVRE